MTLGVFLAAVALGLSGFALVLFPEVRKKVGILTRGTLNVFIEDKAKTPEGAKAIFQQAIDISQDKYAKASNLLRQRAGELETAKQDLLITQKELKELETTCERLVQNGKYEEATLIATQREETLVDLDRQTKLIESLGPVVEECKAIANHQERNLRELKVKKKQIITDLEMNKQMTSMYDDLDELKKVSQVDKLLDSVNDGHKESRQQAIGAKVLHENKLETKVDRVKLKMKDVKNSDYIEELKKKYEKK